MSVEDLLIEPVEIKPIDFLSTEGLQQQLDKFSLEELVGEDKRITREIYCADNVAQIGKLLDLYADERIKQGLLKPSDKLAFKKDKLEQYEHPKKMLYDSPKDVSVFELVNCPAMPCHSRTVYIASSLREAFQSTSLYIQLLFFRIS